MKSAFSSLQGVSLSLILTGTAVFSGLNAAEPAKPLPRRPAPILSPELKEDGSVTFRFKATRAADVKVVGQFGATTNLTRNDEGLWSVTVPGVPAGVHEYHFVVDGVSVLDPQNSAIKPQRSPGSSILQVPARPPAAWDWQEIPHGVVHIHEYHSKVLGKARRMYVYTPPGVIGGEALPVLYLSHGYSDNEATWTVHGKAHWILDALIAGKKAQPMIVVMPDAHSLPTREGAFEEYAVDNTVAYCKELEQDIMPLVEANYKVKEGAGARAFAGLSMGGHHAFTVALNMHDRFSYIGAFSAAPPSQELVSAGLENAAATNKDLKLLWSACGKKDFLRQRNEEFNGLLTAKGIRYEFVETEGDHSWPVWRRYLEEFVPKLFRAN